MHPFERFTTARYALKLWPATVDEKFDSGIFVWLLHHAHEIRPELEDSGWSRNDELFSGASDRGLGLVQKSFERVARPSDVSPTEKYCRRLQQQLRLNDKGGEILSLVLRCALAPTTQELLHACTNLPDARLGAIDVVARALCCMPIRVEDLSRENSVINKLLRFAEKPSPESNRQEYIDALQSSLGAIKLALVLGKGSSERGLRQRDALLRLHSASSH